MQPARMFYFALQVVERNCSHCKLHLVDEVKAVRCIYNGCTVLARCNKFGKFTLNLTLTLELALAPALRFTPLAGSSRLLKISSRHFPSCTLNPIGYSVYALRIAVFVFAIWSMATPFLQVDECTYLSYSTTTVAAAVFQNCSKIEHSQRCFLGSVCILQTRCQESNAYYGRTCKEFASDARRWCAVFAVGSCSRFAEI